MTEANIHRITEGGLDAFAVDRSCFDKLYITVHPEDISSPTNMFFSLAQFLKEHDAKIMSQDIFGCNHDHEEGLAELRKACGEITWPLAWIEGDNCSH